MVLSYVDRCGHLSVPINNPDPVLFMVNGAYRCHSFIFSLSLSFFSPNALPPRKPIRMTDFHVGLSLAQNFCSYSHFFRRAWFPVSGFPLHPPLFFFLFKNGNVFLFHSQKEITVKRTTSASSFPLALLSANEQTYMGCWDYVWISYSRVLAKDERLFCPPHHHGEVRAATTNNLTSRNLVVPFLVVLLSWVTPVKAATCSKQQCQYFSWVSCASAVEDFNVNI